MIQSKPRHAGETPRSSGCRSQGDEQGKNRRRGALQDGAEIGPSLGFSEFSQIGYSLEPATWGAVGREEGVGGGARQMWLPGECSEA